MLFLIWADEKYNTPENPSVVFATQKNPGVFHRPQKIPFGLNVRPKKILRTPPSLKYVSGAPGVVVQFYPWFNSYFFFCFGVWLCMIMSLKQREIIFKQRITLNPNLYTVCDIPCICTSKFYPKIKCGCY